MTAPTTRADESYLDFVQELRAHAIRVLHPRAEQVFRARHGAGLDPAAAREVDFAYGVLRASQEMIWRGTTTTYGRRRAELLAGLEVTAPGTLTLDPDLEMPEYLADYHLQPGGYHGDPLAGYVYHYGTKIFWLGANDDDGAKAAMANALPVPGDGRVEAVLDLACAVGQATTALAQRFPGAAVHGIDVAAPLVRYAHARAAGLGVPVAFRQGLAEDLPYADGSFDLVYASILFHEIPVEVGERVVAEAHRVLRPGGLFVVSDLTPLDDGDPWRLHDRRWDTDNNAEPWEFPFLTSDFDGLLRRAFGEVATRRGPQTTTWTATR